MTLNQLVIFTTDDTPGTRDRVLEITTLIARLYFLMAIIYLILDSKRRLDSTS